MGGVGISGAIFVKPSVISVTPGQRKSLPFGSWPSLITTSLLAEESMGLGQVETDGATVYWSERRPAEARTVVMRAEPGKEPIDLIPAEYSVGTQVHTYGGGAFTMFGETLFFSNNADQRVYAVRDGEDPHPITPDGIDARYADGRITPDGRFLLCVRELHGVPGDSEARNELVAIPADGSAEPRVIASGHDFFASPRLSGDGRRLAWITWDHPNMHWDSSELWVGECSSNGKLSSISKVAGGPGESVGNPVWGPSGELYFASDRTGWYNVYAEDGRALHPAEAEFATPHWQFGNCSFDALEDGRLVCTWTARGESGLGILDPHSGKLTQTELKLPIVERPEGQQVSAGGDGVVLLAASSTEDWSLLTVDLSTGKQRVIRGRDTPIDAQYLSPPEHLEFPTSNDRTAFGFYFPPTNPECRGPEGELPPLLVVSHGGPTGSRSAALQIYIHYFTSRGFAVVDVNYAGSSNHGREYRERLRGQWGVADVDDCVAAARFLVDRGDVDAKRLLIRGGSASGWTTLCAIAFTDVFIAACNIYGVSDLATFVSQTHKFESRYIYGLVGTPDQVALYEERSPLYHADQITTPLIVFQGADDKAVPQQQSDAIVDALRRNGVPVAYICYEDEGHGFRKAENIRRMYELELWFYGRVLGFEPNEKVNPVKIDNEDKLAIRA